MNWAVASDGWVKIELEKKRRLVGRKGVMYLAEAANILFEIITKAEVEVSTAELGLCAFSTRMAQAAIIVHLSALFQIVSSPFQRTYHGQLSNASFETFLPSTHAHLRPKCAFYSPSLRRLVLTRLIPLFPPSPLSSLPLLLLFATYV